MKKFAILCSIIFIFMSNKAVPQNVDLLGSLNPYPNLDYSDIWGYAAGGREYALMGVAGGTSIIDVTNPAAPVEVDFVPGPLAPPYESRTRCGSGGLVTSEERHIYSSRLCWRASPRILRSPSRACERSVSTSSRTLPNSWGRVDSREGCQVVLRLGEPGQKTRHMQRPHDRGARCGQGWLGMSLIPCGLFSVGDKV